MEYFVDKDGQVTGRLYECGRQWAAEIGRRTDKVMGGFIATRGIKSDSRRASEKFLFDNGCVNIAVA